jgi:hypothetical protein
VRDRRIEGAERVFSDDSHRQRIDHLHAVDHREERQPLVIGDRIQHTREVGLHGVGVERRAVVETHARAQMERPRDAIGPDVVALGELRHDLHRVVEGEQRLVPS